MNILVLDTIHGGADIAAAYERAGHSVDAVDIYRKTTPDEESHARIRSYDMIVAPVHMDPVHPLLAHRTCPIVTHHEAVRSLLGNNMPALMVEITGSRGKTTTAHALAHLLPKNGILHTSAGTYECPGHLLLCKKSITPASVLAAAGYAQHINGWLIAEESLGVTGAGNLAIITSAEDYRCAAGKKSALAVKLESAKNCKRLLVAEGIRVPGQDTVTRLESVACCRGQECCIALEGQTFRFTSPLLELSGYRTPLMLAGTAAAMLGIDPAPLGTFHAMAGRMSMTQEQGIVIIDNANSGTNVMTTVEAARYARTCAGVPGLTLVIGTVKGDGAVCEGFPDAQIVAAIEQVQPATVVWVGDPPHHLHLNTPQKPWTPDAVCSTLADAKKTAMRITKQGSIVLSVKTWR
ncbi:MAG: coenzyme F430 synthase [Methanoregula sp.]